MINSYICNINNNKDSRMNINKRKLKYLKSEHPIIIGKSDTPQKVTSRHVVSSSPIVRVSKRPVLKGFRSLGTVGGRISDYKTYLKSSNAKDTANDWMCVGMSIRISISQINKELF